MVHHEVVRSPLWVERIGAPAPPPRSLARRRPRLSPRPGPSPFSWSCPAAPPTLRYATWPAGAVTRAVCGAVVHSGGASAAGPQAVAGRCAGGAARPQAGRHGPPGAGRDRGLGRAGGLDPRGRARPCARGPRWAPTVGVDGAPERRRLDVTACLEHLPGLRWPDLAAAQGELDGAALLRALPAEGTTRVLAGRGRGAPATTWSSAAVAGLGAVCGVTVVDLGCSLRWAEQLHGCCVVVAGTSARHLADATALAARLVHASSGGPVGARPARRRRGDAVRPRRWRCTSTCPWRGPCATTPGSWPTPTGRDAGSRAAGALRGRDRCRTGCCGRASTSAAPAQRGRAAAADEPGRRASPTGSAGASPGPAGRRCATSPLPTPRDSGPEGVQRRARRWPRRCWGWVRSRTASPTTRRHRRPGQR